jgi:capsule polysaccharide export protein KpsE/RkpR
MKNKEPLLFSVEGERKGKKKKKEEWRQVSVLFCVKFFLFCSFDFVVVFFSFLPIFLFISCSSVFVRIELRISFKRK